MEGNGPTGGTPRPMHMLLAARDMYTQDYFAAGLMGLEPENIVMIRQAMEKGFVHPEDIRLAGDPVPASLAPFLQPDTLSLDFTGHMPGFLKKPFAFAARKLFKSYPQLETTRCVGCGKCAESCPAHIIKFRNGKARFQKRGCISCFCCQEMCPASAISVRKAL